VPPNLPVANLTQDVARIAPMGVEPGWLRICLQAPWARSWADQVARGATIRGVNIEDLRRLRIPVPDRSEQRRRVDAASEVLDHLDETRRLVQHQQQLLRERRQALVTAVVTGELGV
jgi:type I restriction enzyme, S subunit